MPPCEPDWSAQGASFLAVSGSPIHARYYCPHLGLLQLLKLEAQPGSADGVWVVVPGRFVGPLSLIHI
eukprot:3771773-Prorocentrum_lima.AAC.1